MERLEHRRDLHAGARGSGDVGARDLKITPSVICFVSDAKTAQHVISLISTILLQTGYSAVCAP